MSLERIEKISGQERKIHLILATQSSFCIFFYLKAVASVCLSVDHVHEVVVVFLRLPVATCPVVSRTTAILMAL